MERESIVSEYFAEYIFAELYTFTSSTQ